MTVAFASVTILYISLAVATVGVSAGSSSKVPLADLLAVGFGVWGRNVTMVLAVALIIGSMNVYLGGACKLAAALADSGSLPAWLAGDRQRTVPRRPLMVILAAEVGLLVALIAGVGNASDLVRATSACFVVVYVAATASAARILVGRAQLAACLSCVLVVVVALFSGWYLLVPAGAAACFTLMRKTTHRRRARSTGHERSGHTASSQRRQM